MTLLTSTTLSAKVEKIIFENPQNGYAVLSVQPQDKTLGKVIVVGTFVSALVGEDVLFQGEWQKHPQHGQQFCAQSCELVKRDTAHAAQRLLVHNLDGIGPSYAKKLHQAFGENLVEILDKKPERLKEVSGIGKARYQKIVQSWQKHKASHETMLFLTSHRLGYAIATKIYKKYGEHTITKIQQNPYQLTEEIEGVGFHTADNIARSLDIDKDAPQRLAAGILYVLQQATKYGHCGIAQSALLEQSATLLGCTKDLLSPLLEDMHQNKKIIIDEVKEVPCVFLPQLWYQEINIAKKLKKMLAKPPSNTASLLKILEEELEKEALSLSKEQHEAIHQALQSNVFILTGGPGVGKTTLVRLLANLFTRRALTLGLGAPTGRAAKRLTEVTGITAKTLHRLLEYDPFTHRFGYDADNLLPYEVVIIDEVSMLDVPLCEALIQALALNTRLIFVGDVDQLSSVGPGDVLRAMISSEKIPFFFLKTIFRQSSHSQIIINAHRVNQGLMPVVEEALTPDFYWVDAHSIVEQQRKITTIVATRLPTRFGFDPLNDIQVLTPMNEGGLGVNTLNGLLQQALNAPERYKAEVQHRDSLFREGDKVIQIVNNYDKNIFNGDIGRVQNILLHHQKVVVLFDQQKIEYAFKELEQLRLAYAISVHKSQGSEYKAVVVVLSMQQRRMLKRNLLYTAISRGKSCVVVVGSHAAIECAVQMNKITQRINKLQEWLRDAT